MWGTRLFPSLCALLFDYSLFPGPPCLLPGMSAGCICYYGLQGSPYGPSSPGQLFLLPLFVVFPVPVKGRWHGLRPSVPFLTSLFPLLFVLPLSRTPFSGVLISPAAYCFISLASYLLSHLTLILQFHLDALRITFAAGCLPTLLLLLLSCCSVVFTSLHSAMLCGRWVKASIHFFSPGKF